ncbi:MAG: 30S ribosomal protein S6 [Bacilli bacterium]|nr:30S ribosomal protein S6 [Bacilli bacterium]
MRKYEVMYIVSEKVGNNNDLAKAVNDNNVFLTKNDAKITKSNISELKDFAYPIKKQSKGYYVILNLSVNDRNQLNEFEQKIRFDTNVLRYVIVKENSKWAVNNKNKQEDKLEKDDK